MQIPVILHTILKGATSRYSELQALRVDSVEGGSFMFWEVVFSAGSANTCAEGASL